MRKPLAHYDRVAGRLRSAGDYIWPVALRLILFWEFWESGITKLRGENWFADIPWANWQKGFPWPFDVLPADLNWILATWGELVFSITLLLGLFTRFSALSLIVITMVATAAVHWPADWSGLPELWQGYVITPDGGGNFKLPLLFLIMLLPLLFHGGGPLSLDRLLLRLRGGRSGPDQAPADELAAALGLLVLGLAVVWVEPVWGGMLFAGAGTAAAMFRAGR